MATKKLTPEVMTILQNSTIDGRRLALPPGQLDRKLYMAVKAALENAGGKWKTNLQAFLFDGDPRSQLGLMLQAGVSVDEKEKFQAFYTPAKLAAWVASQASVYGQQVLEPSAGGGALADACMASGAAFVCCFEIRPETATALAFKGYETHVGDFLTYPVEPIFDRVVMNPPFANNQDVAHVEAALRWLKPGGVLVSIIAANTTRSKFTKLVAGKKYGLQEIEPGAFKESGTNVATLLLTIWT